MTIEITTEMTLVEKFAGRLTIIWLKMEFT